MTHRFRPARPARPAMLALLCAAVLPAGAAVTDIASSPLASAPSATVKPNIMFILDDSGSMAWNYLPDAAENFASNEYGARSSQCNGMYYNPAETYDPPVDAAGNPFPHASFTSAASNGFDPDSPRYDLTGAYYYKYNAKGRQRALAFTYNGNGSVRTNTTFYQECNSDVGDNPGKEVFARVTVSADSGPTADRKDERTNFANWYSYYRTRMQAMKSAAGHAFRNIGSNYRVGLTTINYTGSSSNDKRFLDIDDFDPAQKAEWYRKLYATDPSGNTPLRASLSKAGKIYAGKVGRDPVQYSCQQNFAILSTDGYWNDDAGSTLANREIGNQDGGATERPMYDGSGTRNTLADVAMYYYKTDLRTAELSNCTGAKGTSVCENNVEGSKRDNATHQHMTTMTLGLGMSGTLTYEEDYLLGEKDDYKSILQGTKDWPAVAENSQTTVDDLWHAAVNGRGIYFSAQSPSALVSGIGKALAEVKAETGNGAAAATSNLEPVAGDSFVYVASYTTVSWEGELKATVIDPAKGTIGNETSWSAQARLDALVSAHGDRRTIYVHDAGGAGGLKDFSWNRLSDAEKALFSDMCGATVRLSQCSSLTADEKKLVTGENLVNFLRGHRGHEDQTGGTARIFRDRAHALGDIIGSQPVYLKAPPFAYVDDNYDAFQKLRKGRQPTVFVGANDGMLHAFNAADGEELWAYIPPMVMPQLYRLADANYAANHHYFVDGSPTIGDVCPKAPKETCRANEWKTILVGGLNAGGRGYYALDVTDPAQPRVLWHFTADDDSDLGYSYGNPVITKRSDGTWVVAFSSGYNNVSPGSGRGFLFVLNADSGKVLEKIDTGAGSVTTPSGLSKINAWVNSVGNNTAERFYGGDLLGKVWRFDVDDKLAPTGKEAVLLAELGQVNGAAGQPITTKPELTEITEGGVTHAVVHVATGRYLGVNDLSDYSQQSIYALKDELGAAGLGLVRRDGVLVRQTLLAIAGKDVDDVDEDGNTTETIESNTLRTTSTNPVDWSEKAGWYIDLNPGDASPGERVNIDMQQQLGLLTVGANVPNADACTSGGTSWLYNFDYRTGQFVSTADGQVAGQRHWANAMLAGIKKIKIGDKTVTILTDTKGNMTTKGDPLWRGNGGIRRVSWRELLD